MNHDDLPVVGRSLFDHAIATDAAGRPVAEVPFPFQDLVAHIASRVDGGPAGVRQVLIPLGRSLQRTAAAPDYFGHPRVVTTFDGDHSGADGIFLKDRIYLGYQDAADVLEVISYNEAAGRFEFQVVRNYRSGARPDVRYANRALCLACHQNEAPIFSRPLWSESNANPQVAALLARRAASFHGVPSRGGVDIAQAIDDATDRANRFSTWQRVWRDGCGALGAGARRCRADALLLAVASRLGIPGRLEPESGRLTAALSQAWAERWPDGIEVPQADLPNRDPLVALSRRHGSLAVGDRPAPELGDFVRDQMRRNAIPAHLEPLERRAPGDPLDVARAVEAGEFVRGLGAFFSVDDIAGFDALIAGRSGSEALRGETIDLACRFTGSTSRPQHRRVSVRCGVETGDALHARMYFRGTEIGRGVVRRLHLAGHAHLGLDLAIHEQTRDGHLQRVVATPRRESTAMRVYLAGGDVLDRIELEWSPPSDAASGWPGRARLVLTSGISGLRPVVEGLLAEGSAGHESVLGDGPFARTRMVARLLGASGDPAGRRCCMDVAGLRAALPDRTVDDASRADLSDAEALFVEHCGQCHRSDDPSPPNFLGGAAARVAREIAHCAERIHYRLSMWHRPRHGNGTTPMPPINAILARGLGEQEWRNSAALVALGAHARRLVEDEPGVGAGRAEALLERDYGTLRPCLTASAP